MVVIRVVYMIVPIYCSQVPLEHCFRRSGKPPRASVDQSSCLIIVSCDRVRPSRASIYRLSFSVVSLRVFTWVFMTIMQRVVLDCRAHAVFRGYLFWLFIALCASVYRLLCLIIVSCDLADCHALALVDCLVWLLFLLLFPIIVTSIVRERY